MITVKRTTLLIQVGPKKGHIRYPTPPTSTKLFEPVNFSPRTTGMRGGERSFLR